MVFDINAHCNQKYLGRRPGNIALNRISKLTHKKADFTNRNSHLKTLTPEDEKDIIKIAKDNR